MENTAFYDFIAFVKDFRRGAIFV